MCHEKIRVLSQEAAASVKQEGLCNDLVQRIKKDGYFRPIWDEIDQLLDPRTYIGRASSQVDEFIDNEVSPLISNYEALFDNQIDKQITV